MQCLNNQNGIAIITVLLVLMLISLAGAMVIQTSTNELQIATSDQLHTTSFYAAEAAQSYVILNSALYGSTNLDAADPVNFPNDANPSATQDVATGSAQSFNGEVKYENSMVPPRGSGFQVGKYKAHVYQMVCNGYGPRNSCSQIEVGFYRIGF